MNAVFDGDLGVRCFFIISGFLITWLMIREENLTGSVSLRFFYARRALRILPVYLAFLGVLWLLQCFTPFSQDTAQWLGNLTFTTNFIPATWPSGHLWSLAVEEQFYLIWPVLFVLCRAATHTQRVLKMLGVVMIIGPICRVITFKQFYPPSLSVLFAHFSFLNYFDSLAMGCACALVLGRYREFIQNQLTKNPRATTILGVMLILIPHSFAFLPLPGRVAVFFWNTPQTIGFSLLLLQSILQPARACYRWLNWSWVKQIGVLSYSIYIWQQLFCSKPELFNLGQVWWMSFPGWLLPVFTVAAISYYGFEKPLLNLRARYRKV